MSSETLVTADIHHGAGPVRFVAISGVAEQHIDQEVSRGSRLQVVFPFKELEHFADELGSPVRAEICVGI